MIKRLILLILVVFSTLNASSQTVSIEANFYINSDRISNVKFFQINGMNASPLNYIDGELIMKDLREDNIKILMISEKHKTSFFLDDIRNSQSLNIYYESGIFNRQRIKFRLRNLFRKVYQIDLGFDYVSVVGKSRYKYNFDSY